MSRTTRRLGVTAAATLAMAALGLAPAGAAVNHHGSVASGAVFVQTDSLTANSVVAYDRSSDGTLHQAGTYATGGLGGHLDGAVVDNTASQGAVTLDRAAGLLYVVNAGSDDFTVFAVHGDRLQRLAVVSSRGDFPVSVSAQGSTVYVLNARSGGSVQGFRWYGGHLAPTSHRALGLDATLTPEFTHTPGQVAITPDGRHLVVTTKAAANTIDVYNLDGSGQIRGAVRVTPQDGKVPFAIAFDPAGRLVIANAGDSSVSTFHIGHSGALTALGSAATGQAATCWVTVRGYDLFASNAGSASVTQLTVGSRGSLAVGANTATDAGTVDAAVSSDGRYLYVETGAAGIVDEFAIGGSGSLTAIGSVTVPGAVGAEGIAAS